MKAYRSILLKRMTYNKHYLFLQNDFQGQQRTGGRHQDFFRVCNIQHLTINISALVSITDAYKIDNDDDESTFLH